MRPRAKYAVIHRHRSEYSVSTMCRFFGVSRSGYYDFVRRIGKPEKDADLAAAIRQQQEKSFNTYGYRRMCLALKSKGIHCNPKTILRVMKKYDLLSEIRRRRKWVNMGQQLHRYENLLNRQFHADKPNRKWVTDISYIHTKQGILYLSMIRDLYDNSIVAYKTGTEQTVNLVLDTIRLAMRKEKKRVAAELQLHSDQGFQYTSQAYFKLTQKYGILRPCQDAGTAMTMRWQKIFSPFSKPSVFTDTNRCPSMKPMKRLIVIFTSTTRAHPDKDRSGAADAAPLHLNFISPTWGLFVLSAQTGAVHQETGWFLDSFPVGKRNSR